MGIVERVVSKLGSTPQPDLPLPVSRALPENPKAPDTEKWKLFEQALRSQRPDFLKDDKVADPPHPDSGITQVADDTAVASEPVVSEIPEPRKRDLIEQAFREQHFEHSSDEAVTETVQIRHTVAHQRKNLEASIGEAVTDAVIAQPGMARVGKNPQVLKVDLERLRKQQMITPDVERTPMAECFRRIKRQILDNVANPAEDSEGAAVSNLIMVTSALPGEGKTFCSVNLAISMAMELDRTVLLVDADVAKPTVLSTLGLENGLPGLMDVLAAGSLDLSDVLWKTNIGKLSILPAGTRHANATEMLASETMRALVQDMAKRYQDRIIIFDSPPLLVASEASVLATHMSQVLLVVAAWETTDAALKEALKRLESCEHVGMMLNKGRAPNSGYGYGGHGYRYGGRE